jgi:hypothetical protein
VFFDYFVKNQNNVNILANYKFISEEKKLLVGCVGLLFEKIIFQKE